MKGTRRFKAPDKGSGLTAICESLSEPAIRRQLLEGAPSSTRPPCCRWPLPFCRSSTWRWSRRLSEGSSGPWSSLSFPALGPRWALSGATCSATPKGTQEDTGAD